MSAKAEIQYGPVGQLLLILRAVLPDFCTRGNDKEAVVGMIRRDALKLVAGSLVWQVTTLHAKDTTLPVPASLPQAALSAKVRGEPLVMLISLPGCVYCEMVRRNYLLPGRLNEGLQSWQLNVNDNTTPLTSFYSQSTTAARQAKAWNATFTPTVLFLGNRGQELAERLTGIAVPDFYGAYLEQRLNSARKEV